MFSFECLPFAWTHSRAIFQEVMLRLVRETKVVGVLVWVDLDDVVLIGYSRA